MNDLNGATRSVTSKVPQVSIGMPVYNGAKFIHEALDSLLLQTFTDFELIISDNASTDETEVICRECAAKDSRIRYGAVGTVLAWIALNSGYALIRVHFMYRHIMKQEKWRWYKEDILIPLVAALIPALCIACSGREITVR